MRVASFKVSNYRSIESAEVELANLTCLVGPNNEGKSNLLKALGLGLYALLESSTRRFHGSRGPRYGRLHGSNYEPITYDAERDRPANKSARSRPTITVRFSLNEKECADFHAAVGHTLNGDLSAQVQFTSSGLNIQYKKQRVGSQLTEKSRIIREFLNERLVFQYVPPIRTANDAAQVITTLIRKRLRQLEHDHEYSAAQQLIYRKAQNAMKAVESDMLEVLKRFLPGVKSAALEGDSRAARWAADLDLSSIVIDDGMPTELDSKGSGVQSLAAIALMRHSGSTDNGGTDSVLALEEPEAHLHSGALHQLRPLLAEIAREQQLIFTTHSGLLVPTETSASCVVVRTNQARTSRNIDDVRDALGVRLSDNLMSARLVLVVEGESDVTFWIKALSRGESPVADAIHDNSIAIEALGGSGNLSYQLQNLRRSACDSYVVLDGDGAGRSKVSQALADGTLFDRDHLLIVLTRYEEAELEDLLDVAWAADVLAEWSGAKLDISPDGRKWSSRVKSALRAGHKDSNDQAVKRAKEAVWRAFADCEDACPLSAEGEVFVTQVVHDLAQRLAR